MNKLFSVLMFVCMTGATHADGEGTPVIEGPAKAAQCISVKPVCAPGKRAICICESSYSLKCSWICAW